MDQYDALMTWYNKSLQLRRLVHCMLNKEESDQQSLDSSYEHSSTLRQQDVIKKNKSKTRFHLHRIIQQQQIIEAQSMFGRISGEAELLMHHVDTTQEQYYEILDMVEDLKVHVENACAWVQQNLDASCEAKEDAHDDANADDDDNDDVCFMDLDSAAQLINYVFYENDSSTPLVMDDSFSSESSSSSSSNATTCATAATAVEIHHDTRHHSHSNASSNHNETSKHGRKANKAYTRETSSSALPQDLQQEEDILQEEISNMASQLKQSSLQIKSTLASQNKNLENIEMLAQDNLSKTSQVAQNVTQHVSAGWRHSFRKWFVFLMILATWLFCFLTIRMVPKRSRSSQGACGLWFCNTSTLQGRKKEGSATEEGEEEQDHDLVHAKFSFCHQEYSHGAKSSSQKQCTVPLHPQDHMQSLGKLFNSASHHDAEDTAERIVEQNKGKRMEYHYNRAKREDDHVAASRIREGWKSGNSKDKDNISPNGGKEEINLTKETKQQPINAQNPPSVVKNYTRDDVKRAIFQSDFVVLESIMQSNPELAKVRDKNGWEVLHEAVRKGSVKAASILLNSGSANIDAQVGASGEGGSVLWIAKHLHGNNHEIIQYLRERGATEIPPSQRKNNEL